MQQAEKCPVCKAPWPGNKFVGEKAITTTNQNSQGRRRTTNHDLQSGVGSSTQMSADITGMDEEDGDEDVG